MWSSTCVPIKQMRALGQQRNAANRPLTPFELMCCGGNRIDMRVLWANMHPMFVKRIGKIEAVNIKQHGVRGMLGIYLGAISAQNNVTQFGHLMLRHSDKKEIKVRTVTVQPGVYPLRVAPTHTIKQYAWGREHNQRT